MFYIYLAKVCTETWCRKKNWSVGVIVPIQIRLLISKHLFCEFNKSKIPEYIKLRIPIIIKHVSNTRPIFYLYNFSATMQILMGWIIIFFVIRTVLHKTQINSLNKPTSRLHINGTQYASATPSIVKVIYTFRHIAVYI